MAPYLDDPAVMTSASAAHDPVAASPPPPTTTTAQVQDALSQTLKQPPPLVAPEPEHCPGPTSAAAGQAASCEGCPNRSICASMPKGPDPDVDVIKARLADVQRAVLVLSGKGGVGKSTFTMMLGRAAAAAAAGMVGTGTTTDGITGTTGTTGTIGIMDADVCGPSLPRMLGVEAETVHVSGEGWSPVWAGDNLCVMSVQFLLPGRDDAVIWRGPKKNGLIRRFLRDVAWGPLDLLLVDTPPGTSDEHLSVAALLRETGRLAGALIVATPQEVSLLDVRKEIDFCRRAGIRVLGVVENMAGFVCPGCRHESQIFRATTGGAEAMAAEMRVPFLGRVPLDPRIGQACDYGESFFEHWPESPACVALRDVVDRLGKELGVDLDGMSEGE